MDINQFLQSAGAGALAREDARLTVTGAVDLSRAAAIEVDRDLYSEADARGLTLSELLEANEFDPSAAGSPIDAFERQLALAGVQLGGHTPTTIEQFFQKASVLMPEFILREIKRGQAMRPELGRLIAKYHDEKVPGGRRFQVFLGSYPTITKKEEPAGPSEQRRLSGSPHTVKRGRH